MRKTPRTSSHRTLELGQALQSAAPGIEEEFLIPGLYQCAWPKAVHDRRWTTGTEEGHPDVLSLCGHRGDGRN